MKKLVLILLLVSGLGLFVPFSVQGQQGAGWEMAITPFAHLYEEYPSKKEEKIKKNEQKVDSTLKKSDSKNGSPRTCNPYFQQKFKKEENKK